jgi:hypothetical protein
MNGKHTSLTGDKEGSEESGIGAAIRTLAVRDLQASVKSEPEGVRLSLVGDDEAGHTHAGVWMTPEKARELAAQLLQCAEVAEQFDPEVPADE